MDNLVPDGIVRATEYGHTAVVQRWLANGGDRIRTYSRRLLRGLLIGITLGSSCSQLLTVELTSSACYSSMERMSTTSFRNQHLLRILMVMRITFVII